jgi:hypothetical protein
MPSSHACLDSPDEVVVWNALSISHICPPVLAKVSFSKLVPLDLVVTATRVCGRAPAIIYNRLSTTLRSVAIILPIHLGTITQVYVCKCIPLITIPMPIRPKASIRTLTLSSLFSKWISFAPGTSPVYPFTDVSHHKVYN